MSVMHREPGQAPHRHATAEEARTCHEAREAGAAVPTGPVRTLAPLETRRAAALHMARVHGPTVVRDEVGTVVPITTVVGDPR